MTHSYYLVSCHKSLHGHILTTWLTNMPDSDFEEVNYLIMRITIITMTPLKLQLVLSVT